MVNSMASPIKPTIKTEIVPIVLVGASLIASVYFYRHFPDRVVTHWNFAGQPDGYSSKAFAAFFFPLLNLGMYLLFLGLPYLDPKKNRYPDFAKVYHVFKAVIIGVMSIIYGIVGLAGLGYSVAVEKVLPAIIGVLFIVMGNYMAKIKPNWFMGIRTPWTLSSEEVWNKTHQLGGKLFVLMGVLMVAMGFWNNKIMWYIFTVGVIGVALVPMVYSFILYRKLKSNTQHQ